MTLLNSAIGACCAVLIAVPASAQLTYTVSSPLPMCSRSMLDQAGGPCIHASAIPTLGDLLPYPGLANSFSNGGYVTGGENNVASGLNSFLGAGRNNTVSGADSTLAGGRANLVTAFRGTLSGGINNTLTGDSSVIGGGETNIASGNFSTIAGGVSNQASGLETTIGGGSDNLTSAQDATVGGGIQNQATGIAATVSGGFLGTASAFATALGGGERNSATDEYATVPGGRNNQANGSYSFAAGRRALANHSGAFVWGDATAVDKASTAANQFNVFASGGTRIFSDSMATTGVLLAPGGGTWTMVSDRNAKEAFETVDGTDVLERLASIPITTWSYKAQDGEVRHMGPMAQDFFSAFGLGLGATSIDTIDPNGVALAAIQALDERDREFQQQLDQKDQELAELRAQLARIEARLDQTAE